MPDSLRPLHAGPAGDRLPLYPLEAAGARGAARACRHALSPRLVIATYVVAGVLLFGSPHLAAQALYLRRSDRNVVLEAAPDAPDLILDLRSQLRHLLDRKRGVSGKSVS